MKSLTICSSQARGPIMRRPELHHQILAPLNSDRTVHICQAVERDSFNFIDFPWEIRISGSRLWNQVEAQNLPSLHHNDCKIAGTDNTITFRTGSATAHGTRRTLQETSLGLDTGAQPFRMATPLNSILGLHRTPGPLCGTTCHQEPYCGVFR